MSTRKLLVLTGVFVALLAFVVFFERKQPTSDERAKAAKRLADFKAEDVVSVTLERPDLPKVELVRKDKGRWTVANAPASPGGRIRRRRPRLGPRIGSRSSARRARRSTRRSSVSTRRRPRRRSRSLDKSTKVFSFGAPIPGTDAVAAAAGPVFGAVKQAPLAALTKPVDEYRSKQLFDVAVG